MPLPAVCFTALAQILVRERGKGLGRAELGWERLRCAHARSPARDAGDAGDAACTHPSPGCRTFSTSQHSGSAACCPVHPCPDHLPPPQAGDGTINCDPTHSMTNALQTKRQDIALRQLDELLPDLLSELEGRVAVVKIDVEGNELSVGEGRGVGGWVGGGMGG